MISANELRNVQASKYSNEEITYIIQQACDTIEAYEKENKEIYSKMEVLAGKIEEYREEEDSIKAALITAEKSAQHTRKESKQKAETLIEESEATAKKTLDDAKIQSDKIIAQAREYATTLVNDNTKEAEKIIEEAESKANEAINSSKVIAQNILDQAKEISTELLSKSKQEKLAYTMLIKNIKSDAFEFVEKLQALYSEQLDALKNANFESTNDDNIDDIQSEVDSLIKEIDDMNESFPSSIYLEDLEEQNKEIEEKQEISNDIENIEAKAEEVAEETVEETVSSPIESTVQNEAQTETIIQDSEQVSDNVDINDAINDFSSKDYIPYEKTTDYIEEIDEEPEMQDVYSNPQDDSEKSLFDDDDALSFENFFNVDSENKDNRNDVISLIPPENEEEPEEPKFKGLFGRKKNK